jgi:hypothetical protein
MVELSLRFQCGRNKGWGHEVIDHLSAGACKGPQTVRREKREGCVCRNPNVCIRDVVLTCQLTAQYYAKLACIELHWLIRFLIWRPAKFFASLWIEAGPIIVPAEWTRCSRAIGWCLQFLSLHPINPERIFNFFNKCLKRWQSIDIQPKNSELFQCPSHFTMNSDDAPFERMMYLTSSYQTGQISLQNRSIRQSRSIDGQNYDM